MRTTFAIIILAIILGVLGWMYYGKTKVPPNVLDSGTAQAGAPADTSDTAIQKDLDSIDGQINSFKNDTADMNAGLSETGTP